MSKPASKRDCEKNFEAECYVGQSGMRNIEYQIRCFGLKILKFSITAPPYMLSK